MQTSSSQPNQHMATQSPHVMRPGVVPPYYTVMTPQGPVPYAPYPMGGPMMSTTNPQMSTMAPGNPSTFTNVRDVRPVPQPAEGFTDVDQLRVPELQAILQRYNVPYHDLLEKSDLIKRVKDVLAQKESETRAKEETERKAKEEADRKAKEEQETRKQARELTAQLAAVSVYVMASF